MAPNWRGQGIGKTLQTWLEARQREIAAGHTDAIGHSHHVFVQEGETAKVAMLVKAGYHAERYFFAMVRPTLNNILDFALPLGLEIRPVQSDQLRKIWDAHGRKRGWTEFISVGESVALPGRSHHAACMRKQPLTCKIPAWVWMAQTWTAQIAFIKTAALW